MTLGRSAVLAILLLIANSLFAQDVPSWNLNIGGGVGFPLSSTQNFVNDGGHFVVGGGPNFGRFLGLSGEFMLHDLPIKHSVMDAQLVPGASAREYALTINAIIRIPTAAGRAGFYLIGGAGWYQRSGELSATTPVPGIVCPAFWVWWGACVKGLFPETAISSSTINNAFGGNVGGGFTFRLGSGSTKFYTEVRYHHASHDHVDTDLLPLTFGVRW